MTLGEKILYYRNMASLSQAEIGQKLNVSSETVNLWETNQAMPTVEQLTLLKQILNVSLDILLNDAPIESYNFKFTKEEIANIHNINFKKWIINPIIMVLLCLFIIISSLGEQSSEAIIGFGCGLLLINLIYYTKAIITFKKAKKLSMKNIDGREYRYKIFGDHFILTILQDGEEVRYSKIKYEDIDKWQDIGQYLIYVYGGQNFLLKKSKLSNYSIFYRCMQYYLFKQIKPAPQGKWKGISISLVIASIATIWAALALIVAIIGHINSPFARMDAMTSHMWVFYLFLPVPITSIWFGFFLKQKGYKYKKNVITGIIMAVLLCIYGSFVFMF